MKIFHVPDFNTTVLSPNKSGSLQIINMFKYYLDLKGIKFNLDWHVKPGSKLYILVRNPIDRFLTSYNWFMVTESLSFVRKKLKIENLYDFITKYELILSNINYDNHIAPQSYSFHNIDVRFDTSKEQLKKLIDEKYEGVDYEFIHMEDIDSTHDEFMKNTTIIHDLSHTEIEINEKNCIMNHFPTMIMTAQEKLKFEMVYHFIRDLLKEKAHHKNSRENITNIVDYVSLILEFELLKNELELFGYYKSDRLKNEKPNFI